MARQAALRLSREESPEEEFTHFDAVELRDLFGPHYLQVHVMDGAFGKQRDLMDGYRYSKQEGQFGAELLPTAAQAELIEFFVAYGPGRLAEQFRKVLLTLMEAGVTQETLHLEVDRAIVKKVMDT